MSRKILSLVALVACSSQQKSETLDGWANVTPAGRSPAGVGPQTPFVPGKPSHNAQPTKPNQPVSGGKDTVYEAMSKCSLSLDQVPVGQNYSVSQLLSAAMSRQQFFGGYYDYFTTESMDRALLAPWFGGAQSGPGTEVFEASKSSRAYFRALQYVSGAQSNYFGNVGLDQVGLGKQFAAFFVAIVAVSVDPMCVDAVLESAKRSLGDQAFAELDELRTLLKGASEAMRDGKIDDKFKEIDAKREVIAKQIRDNERALIDAEKKDKRVQKNLQLDLQSAATELRRQLVEIPACHNAVKFVLQTALPDADPQTLLKGLVDRCREALDKRLDDLGDDERRQHDKIARLIEKRGEAGEPSEEEIEVNNRLASIQEKVRKVNGLIELIESKSDEQSINSKLDKIDEILKRQKSVAAGDNLKPIKTKGEQLRADLELHNSPWLTYGFMGGYGYVKPLGVRR
jgi:hypothetical protein